MCKCHRHTQEEAEIQGSQDYIPPGYCKEPHGRGFVFGDPQPGMARVGRESLQGAGTLGTSAEAHGQEPELERKLLEHELEHVSG